MINCRTSISLRICLVPGGACKINYRWAFVNRSKLQVRCRIIQKAVREESHGTVSAYKPSPSTTGRLRSAQPRIESSGRERGNLFRHCCSLCYGEVARTFSVDYYEG